MIWSVCGKHYSHFHTRVRWQLNFAIKPGTAQKRKNCSGRMVPLINVDFPVQRHTSLLTSDRAYLRLHAKSQWYLYNYSLKELEELATLARRMGDQGASRVYFFFNNDVDGFAPANAGNCLRF
jgi:uncharacterized protein YecE (DUF72 family)